MSTEKRSIFSQAVRQSAERRPELCPAPHVSPAILEFRLRQVTAERDELAEALRDCIAAFDNRGETTSLKVWNDRMKEAQTVARALLARIKR